MSDTPKPTVEPKVAKKGEKKAGVGKKGGKAADYVSRRFRPLICVHNSFKLGTFLSLRLYYFVTIFRHCLNKPKVQGHT